MSELFLKAEKFLTAYVAAFEASDAARIARFYHAPCLTVRGDGQITTFSTPTEARDFFATVTKGYREEGMSSFVFDELDVAHLGDAAARLTCRWKMVRDDGSTIRDWRQTYVVECSKDAWTIVSSVFHR